MKAFDIPITRKDLQTLYYGRWLNDEIVNFYFNLIMERSKKLPSFPKVAYLCLRNSSLNDYF